MRENFAPIEFTSMLFRSRFKVSYAVAVAHSPIESKMDYNCFPFRVPDTVKESTNINMILSESFNLQKRHNVSNACGFVNIVLKKCFDVAGIASKIVYGKLMVENFTTPHVWLEIGDFTLDNTYVEDIPEHIFIPMKMKCQYVAKSPQSTKDFVGDIFTKLIGIDYHNSFAFEWMFHHSEQYLMLSKNIIPMKRYYRDMSNFMEYNMDMSPLQLQQNDTCWWCRSRMCSFIKCDRCNVARYCNQQCMLADKSDIHHAICVLPSSK